ncbi:MAG: C2H2-type zinc finger protein, partial [Thermoproteota archaeon]|nr:C2H2-type zinc finger protein [Thermoproteota archaeon]
VAAIPNIKYHEFVLSPIEEEGVIDTNEVVASIKEFLESIGEQRNFAVISRGEIISIESIAGKTIERDSKQSAEGLFSCPHCGHITPYETVHQNHMKIHYF